MNLFDVKELADELSTVMINFTEYHSKMRNSRLFYKNSAFYERQAGQSPDKNNIYENLLQVFADKNIEYTSGFPSMKILPTGADSQERQAASIREKILYATHRKNGTPSLQKKWAFDATIFSVAVAETIFDIKERCVKISRYNPRKVYWKLSNDNERRVIAFWAVFAVTKQEAKDRYGVEPKADLISLEARQSFSPRLDGQEWFTMAIRWDGATRVMFIGDALVEEPHNHMQGEIPIDLAAPIDDGDDENYYPGFYLDPLVPLQAELNDTFYRRSRIVRRMSSPMVWVRGIPPGKKTDDIQDQMSQPGGGVLGLTPRGEAGLLQMQETRMLNDHEDRTIIAMTRLAGYGNAAFGESVGANTSGDALGMYFNATQRKVEHQNIDWVAFYESINAKILRLYDKFLKTGEQVQLRGYAPGGTLRALENDPDGRRYSRDGGAFDVTFDKSAIAGNYTSIVTPPSVTPKNSIDEKRLVKEAVQQKFISRTTGYDLWGILSPEDELALLQQEQQDPVLNPDGMQKIAQAFPDPNQAALNNPPQPSPLPLPPAGGGGGYVPS